MEGPDAEATSVAIEETAVHAVTIQRHWRGFSARNEAVRLEYARIEGRYRNREVLKIQCMVRHFLSLRRAQNRRSQRKADVATLEELEAVTYTAYAAGRLQKWFRGCVQRSRFQRQLNMKASERNLRKHHLAARSIQGAYRTAVATTDALHRRNAREREQQWIQMDEKRAFHTHSAEVIQRGIRCAASRAQVEGMREERELELTCEFLYEKAIFRVSSIEVLQRAVRRWLALGKMRTARILRRYSESLEEQIEAREFAKHLAETRAAFRKQHHYVAALLSTTPVPRPHHVSLLAAQYSPLSPLLDAQLEDPPPTEPLKPEVPHLALVLQIARGVTTRRMHFWERPAFKTMSRGLDAAERGGRDKIMVLEQNTNSIIRSWWLEVLAEETRRTPSIEEDKRGLLESEIFLEHLQLFETYWRSTVLQEGFCRLDHCSVLQTLEYQYQRSVGVILNEEHIDHLDNDAVWGYMEDARKTPYVVRIQCLIRVFLSKRKAKFLKFANRRKREAEETTLMEEAEYQSLTSVHCYEESFRRTDIALQEATEGGVVAEALMVSFATAAPSQIEAYITQHEPRLRTSIETTEETAWEAIHEEEKPSFLLHYKTYMARLLREKAREENDLLEESMRPQVQASMRPPLSFEDERDTLRRHIEATESATRNVLKMVHLKIHSTLQDIRSTVKEGLKGALQIMQDEAKLRLSWGLPVEAVSIEDDEGDKLHEEGRSDAIASIMPPVQFLEEKDRDQIVVEESAYRRIVCDIERESETGRNIAALCVRIERERVNEERGQRESLVRAAVNSFITSCARDESIRRAECDRFERKSRRTIVTAELRARPKDYVLSRRHNSLGSIAPPQRIEAAPLPQTDFSKTLPARLGSAKKGNDKETFHTETAPLPPLKGAVVNSPHLTDLGAYEEKYQRLLRVSKKQQKDMRLQQQLLREEEEALLSRYSPADETRNVIPQRNAAEQPAADNTAPPLRPLFVPWHSAGERGGLSARSAPIARKSQPNVTVKQVLRNQTSTACLDMEGLDWGVEEIMQYLVALAKNRTITVLKLGGNKLTYELLVMLAELIRMPSCRLVSIRMNTCCLTAADMEIILAALAENTSVVGVDISGNPRLDSVTSGMLSELISHRRVKRVCEIQNSAGDYDHQQPPVVCT